MTIQRKIHATVLAAAIALGCVAIPAAAASAAPAAPSYIVTGGDGLAPFANAALDAWVAYSRTGSTRSLKEFTTLRDAIAAEAAHRLGLDVGAMQAAWRRADYTHQVVLVSAFTQLGVPYRRNTSAPGRGFDCSGLTSFAWGQSGRSLPRQSAAQIRNAKSVTREQAQAGDLVFYPGHIMMYLGVGNAIIHSPNSGNVVEVANFSKSRTNSVRFGNPMG